MLLFHGLTSGDPEHPHHPEDGGIDWHQIRLHLLQGDAHNGQEDDRHVQLVPTENINREEFSRDVNLDFTDR